MRKIFHPKGTTVVMKDANDCNDNDSDDSRFDDDDDFDDYDSDDTAGDYGQNIPADSSPVIDAVDTEPMEVCGVELACSFEIVGRSIFEEDS